MSTTRGYLNDAQYKAITGAESLGDDADRIINQAEAIIDGLLGFWQPYVGHLKGVLASGTGTALQLSATDARNLPGINFLKGCVIEMLSGEAEGQYRVVKAQDAIGGLTIDKAFEGDLSTGDVYHVYQMGKVPRRGESDDISTLSDSGTVVYVKTVPSALREAVAWQVKYMQEMGDGYFDGDTLHKTSESFNGAYSYTKKEGSNGLIAPKARDALRGTGLINRMAQITGY